MGKKLMLSWVLGFQLIIAKAQADFKELYFKSAISDTIANGQAFMAADEIDTFGRR